MFFLTIIPIVVFSQNGPLDTVFVKRDLGKIKMDTFYIEGGLAVDQWLIGTTVLKNSPKNIQLRNDGFIIKEVKKHAW